MDAEQPLSQIVLTKLNTSFARNPFMMTLVISGLVGLLVWLLTLSGGVDPLLSDKEAKVVLGESDSVSSADSHQPNEDFILVDVSGAVENPGVYRVKAGSRINDALKLSGGFVSSASAQWVSESLNLAGKLFDSAKIYIPYEWDLRSKEEEGLDSSGLHKLVFGLVEADKTITSVSGGSLNISLDGSANNSGGNSAISVDEDSESTSSKLDSKIPVNKATEKELDGLSGIGPVYVAKIVATRPFANFDDMVARSGVPESVLEKIKSSMAFD